MPRLKLQKPIVRFADGWSANLELTTPSKTVKNASNIKWRRGFKRGTAKNVNNSKIHLVNSKRYAGSPNYDVYIIDTDRDGGNNCFLDTKKEEVNELQNRISELENLLQEDYMTKALKSVQFTRQIEGKIPIIVEKKESAPVVAQYFPMTQQREESKLKGLSLKEPKKVEEK